MKSLRIFFAVLLTVVTLTHSTPSQATVGAFVAAPVLIAGIAITGTGVIGTAIYASKCGNGDLNELCKAFIVILGIPVIAVGLIVLDGEQDIAFSELSAAEASKIGVSAADLAIYNSEIDQANMLMADVKSELSQLEKPTAQDSAKAWSAVRDFVSPATYATMQKIVSPR